MEDDQKISKWKTTQERQRNGRDKIITKNSQNGRRKTNLKIKEDEEKQFKWKNDKNKQKLNTAGKSTRKISKWKMTKKIQYFCMWLDFHLGS